MIGKASPSRSHPTVSCSACDADFPLETRAARVTCPRCGALNDVPPFMAEAAGAAASTPGGKDLQAIWADALETRFVELKHARGQRYTAWSLRLLPAAVFLPALSLLMLSGMAPLWASITLVASGICAWWALMHLFVLSMAPVSVADLRASGLGTCNTCGGPVPLEQGEVTSRCIQCGATLSTGPSSPGGTQAPGRDVRFEGAEQAIARTWRNTALDMANAKSVTWAFIALTMAGVPAFLFWGYKRPPSPTGWILPTMAVGYGLSLVWFWMGYRRGMRGVRELEREMGRRVKLPATAWRPER